MSRSFAGGASYVAMKNYAVWMSRPVFVSSTFHDMQVERDWLHAHVFPALAERLRNGITTWNRSTFAGAWNCPERTESNPKNCWS